MTGSSEWNALTASSGQVSQWRKRGVPLLAMHVVILDCRSIYPRKLTGCEGG